MRAEQFGPGRFHPLLLSVFCFLTNVICIFVLVSIRLKAVKNIQKITKSMKMVSAAKYARAEKELKPARTYGLGAQGL